jgi:cytoskeleton protein RodZ
MSEAEPVTERLSPGKALAAARAELKLSVSDVSQQIKYGVKQIAAIESDDYAKLPGATFVRGMIRSYAKLVQIDPEPLLADLGRRDIPAAATVDLRTSRQEPFIEGGGKSNRIYVSLSVVALVAVAVVVYKWQINPPDTGQVVTITPRSANEAEPPAPTHVPSAPAPASASSAAAAPGMTASAAAASTPAAPPSAKAPSAPGSAAAPAPASAPESADAGGAQTPQPVGQASQPAAQTAEAAAAAGEAVVPKKRIELTFDQLSWVEIKQADGKILLSQLNQPGTKRVIEGTPPFDIVIGNAASVKLKYNDAPIDLRPYFKVDVARLKLE